MRNLFKVSFHSLFSIAVTAIMITATPLQAKTEESIIRDDWQFDAQVYIWASDFGGEMDIAGGTPFDVSFDTLVDNLKMGFYGSFEARKQKWLIFTDVVYLNVETEAAAPAPSNPILSFSARNVQMKGGAVNLIGGYNLLVEGKSRLDLIGGARYLDLGSDFGINVTFIGDTTTK